eukprot:gene7430-7494_t
MELPKIPVNFYLKFCCSILIVLTTGSWFTPVQAQKLIKDYVIKNAVTLKTISPDSTDDSDLKPIGDAIGNAKIVMLGEQDHGDAPAFLAKTRLIKYLHEKKGFNVLAFESDFFALNYGWDKTSKKSPLIDSFILKNIFSVWTTCDACNSLLFKYIPATCKTASPLTLTGAMQLPVTRRSNYTTEIWPYIDSIKRWSFFYPKDTVGIEKSIVYLHIIRNELALKLSHTDFWLYTVDNEIGLANEIKKAVKSDKNVDQGRDALMAANLAWLMQNKFKDQKIIVWAADVHIARNIAISKYYPQMNETMGGKFMEQIVDPDDVYTIGFTSYEGMAGRVGSPGKQQYAFIDFKAFNKVNPQYKEAFYATPITHAMGLGQWNQVQTNEDYEDFEFFWPLMR